MKISVIIPVYNAAPYLATCLDSVLRQTHADWECLCVNDGSTDGSGDILNAYAAKDGRFHVIHQANAGVSVARNAGMAQATGDLITFLDSDDTYDSRALEVLAEVWRRTNADVIRYGCNVVDSHARDVPLSGLPAFAVVDVNASDQSPIRRCNLGWATAIVPRVAENVRWPGLTHCEDPLFVLRCLRFSDKSVWIDGSLANYLVRPDSAARTVSLNIITATCRYLVLAYDACADLPGFDASRADTCAFIAQFLDGPLAACGRDVPREDRPAAEAAVRTARNLLALRDAAFARYACRETHDFAFVLGSSCTATAVLREANLQFGTFPLDWIGRLTVESRTTLIAQGFADFLSLDRLVLEPAKDDGRHARYVDSREGTAFFHDFPAGTPLAESYAAVCAKYDRRIARFMRLLREAKSVLILWVSDFRDGRDGIDASDAVLSKGLDRLSRTFPRTHFSMLVFDQAEAGAPPRECRVADGRIRRVALDYRDWGHGPDSWLLRTDVLLPYLSGHRVRDYRTAAEKRAFRQRRKQLRYERLHVTSWWEALCVDVQYRILRHLQKRLTRKGVQLT